MGVTGTETPGGKGAEDALSDPSTVVAVGDPSTADPVDPENPDLLIVAGSPARALRCTAMLSDGSDRCRRPANSGGTICDHHGAAAPQVKRANQRRLATKRAEKKLADWGYEPMDDPLAAMADLAGRAVALVDAISAELADGNITTASIEVLGAAIERAHRQAKDLASTGFEAARLKLEEDKLDLLARVMRRAWAELGHDEGDPRVQAALEVAYTEIEAGG